MTVKFRPQGNMQVFIMKARVRTGCNNHYQPWQTRIEWFPVGYKINKKTISRQFGKLHYLACHSPKPIAKKWQLAYNLFMDKHFATKGKASIRFLNKHTCHSWL